MTNEASRSLAKIPSQGSSRRDWLRAAAGCVAAGALAGVGGLPKGSEAEASAQAERHKIKIRDVKFYNLEAKLSDPFAWPNGYAGTRTATAIRSKAWPRP